MCPKDFTYTLHSLRSNGLDYIKKKKKKGFVDQKNINNLFIYEHLSETLNF